MEKWDKLTKKQRLIAAMAAYRNPQKDIANALGISVYTVNNVMRRIYEKLETDEQGLFMGYFGIEPASNPIANYDTKPKVSILRRIGAAILAGVLLTQIVSSSVDMMRGNSRSSTRGGISRVRTARRRDADFYYL